MLFSDLVATSHRVAATRARTDKIGILADVIGRLAPDEVAPAVWFLAGEIRQGRAGVGYRQAFAVEAAPAPDPTLRILDVDAALDVLVEIGGPGSEELRRTALSDLLAHATAAEQEFLRRLLVGEVRQGASEGIVTEAVATAAGVAPALVRRALMLTGDLGEVARIALTAGASGLAAIRMRVMTPIRPMLASTADSVDGAVRGEVSVEGKLDGARIQVHRLGDEVRVFTRNLNDVTDRLPGVVAAAKGLDVESVVLDGEAVALRDDGTPRPFQETMSRFGTEAAATEPDLHPFFFDVLFLDGDPTIDLPLAERLRLLDGLVPAETRVRRLLTAEVDEARRFFDEAVAAGQEGVMIKDLDSRYEAGRRGKAWRKVKPVHTFDLVVLAAEWGSGRRRGWLSNIHLGARDGDEFVMVGKTFKGMTDEMLRRQTRRFLELEERRTRTTVFVRPEQVVEVAVDGVQASPRYPGGIALRFARVRRYRDDKTPAEANTLDDLRALLR